MAEILKSQVESVETLRHLVAGRCDEFSALLSKMFKFQAQEDLSMRPGSVDASWCNHLAAPANGFLQDGASAALTPTPQLQGSGANHPQGHLSASRPPPPRLYAEEVWPSRSTQHPPRPRRPCPSWPLAQPSSHAPCNWSSRSQRMLRDHLAYGRSENALRSSLHSRRTSTQMMMRERDKKKEVAKPR